MVRVLVSGVVALVLTVCGLCSNAVASDLPNVIYIMLDDLGPGEYDVYNNLQGLGQDSKIATPNINAMAANGMRFTNAHAATSLCAPTRAAVMAGTPTWQTRVRWGTGSASLQDGQQGVGDLMQAAGYNTAIMGKGHIGGSVPSNLDNPLGDGMKQHGYDYTLQLLRGIQAGPYVFWENDLATTVDADGNSTRITSANEATMTTYWPNGYDDGVTEIYSGSWGAVDFKTRDVPQAMLNKAVGFMNDNIANTPSEPFFLHYNSVAGHWPYVAPEAVRVDINGDGDTADAGEFYNVDGYDGTGPAPDDRGTESMQMVSVSDAEVGVLISYLEQTDDPRHPGSKLIDNTMIIYTSDNGGIGPNYTNQFGPLDREEWDVYGHDSTAGLRDSKASSREGGHRVPFIVQWNGVVEAGSVRDQRISNIDLMGTLAGLTGQSLTLQGNGSFNMLPAFTGKRDDSDPIRDNLVVEDVGGASDGGVRRKLYYEGDWKLSITNDSSSVVEVYDLANDPGETDNLINSSSDSIQRRIDEMYARYLLERNAFRMAPVFIGRDASEFVFNVNGLGDFVVEGVLEGSDALDGGLEVNGNGVLRIENLFGGGGLGSPPPVDGNRLKVAGDFSSRGDSVVEIDLQGKGEGGTHYEQLAVTGTAVLRGGGLSVSIDGVFDMDLGYAFYVLYSNRLEGRFDNAKVSLPGVVGIEDDGVALALMYTDRVEDLDSDDDLVSVLATYRGDFNGDGTVNETDLARLTSNWLTTDSVWQDGDSSYDGQVNPTDLAQLTLNWRRAYELPADRGDWGTDLGSDGGGGGGGGSGGGGIPEPTSLALLGLGAVALVRRRV